MTMKLVRLLFTLMLFLAGVLLLIHPLRAQTAAIPTPSPTCPSLGHRVAWNRVHHIPLLEIVQLKIVQLKIVLRCSRSGRSVRASFIEHSHIQRHRLELIEQHQLSSQNRTYHDRDAQLFSSHNITFQHFCCSVERYRRLEPDATPLRWGVAIEGHITFETWRMV